MPKYRYVVTCKQCGKETPASEVYPRGFQDSILTESWAAGVHPITCEHCGSKHDYQTDDRQLRDLED